MAITITIMGIPSKDHNAMDVDLTCKYLKMVNYYIVALGVIPTKLKRYQNIFKVMDHLHLILIVY